MVFKKQKKNPSYKFEIGYKLILLNSSLFHQSLYQVLDEGEALVDVNDDLWIRLEDDGVFSTYAKIKKLETKWSH